MYPFGTRADDGADVAPIVLLLFVRVPSDFTASTFDLATARKGVVRSEVSQREAAVGRPGILRIAEPIASLAAG